MEINNFREAFERGDDPTADMTDASDINSVAGVLKLYLRCSSSPSSSSISSPLSPPGSCETQYFLFNTLTSSWSLHVSSFFSQHFNLNYYLQRCRINNFVFLPHSIDMFDVCSEGEKSPPTIVCPYIQSLKSTVPHWAGGQGNVMGNSVSSYLSLAAD